VGSTLVTRALGKLSKYVGGSIMGLLFDKLRGGKGVPGISQTGLDKLQQSDWGVSSGWSWAQYTNNATACIGEGASVRSVSGSIDVSAEIKELPENTASSTVASDFKQMNTRKTSASVAVTVGLFTNNATAYIGRDATVQALEDVSVTSKAEFPYEIRWNVIDSISDVSDILDLDIGIDQALLTSTSHANVAGKEDAYGGSFNVLRLDNNSHAYINEGANLILDGALTVHARGDNRTVNMTGPTLPNLLLMKGAAGGDNGVGGAVSWIRYDNTVDAKILSGATVTAGSVLVFAKNREGSITLTEQGGTADSLAFNGALGRLMVTNTTKAIIDDGTQIATLGGGQVAVPRKYDTVSDGFLLDTISRFDPTEEYEEGGATVKRIDGDTIILPYEHGLETGDPVIYRNAGGEDIDGLDHGTVYWAVKVGTDTLQLAFSENDALAEPPPTIPLGTTAIEASLTPTTSLAHSLFPAWDDDEVVDLDDDRFNLPYEHRLSTGQSVLYDNGGDADIGGLTGGTTYYVVVVDEDSIRLAATEAEAMADTPTIIDLSAYSAGQAHSLTPFFDEDGFQVEVYIRSLDSNQDGKVDTNDDHIVSKTGESYVTDLDVLVLAEDDADLYNFSGGVTKGRNTGVGVSIAYDLIDRETKALIGNEEFSLSKSEFAPGVGVDSGDLVNLGYAHGFSSGDEVVYSAGGDFVILGLTDGERYYVDPINETTIRLGRSPDEATATFDPTSVSVVVDSEGTETIDLGYTHGLHTGDPVIYSSGGGTDIGGLTDGQTYYVIATGDSTIALAESRAEALAAGRVPFRPHDHVLDDADTIDFGYNHELTLGQVVVYDSGGGVDIGGLTDGGAYYVILVDETTIQLSSDPNKLTAADAIDLDASVAYGSVHGLHPGFDPANAVETTTDTVAATTDLIDLGYGHDLLTGQAVRYDVIGGAGIAELADGGVYHVIVVDETTIALAESEDDAELGRFRFFDVERDVDADNQTIDLLVEHGFSDGDPVIFSTGGAGDIGGLVDGETYYVIAVDDPN